MDIKDYFKKHGKQFLKSAAKYSKQKPKETVKPFVEKTKQNPMSNIDNDEQPKIKKDRLRKRVYKAFQTTYISTSFFGCVERLCYNVRLCYIEFCG